METRIPETKIARAAGPGPVTTALWNFLLSFLNGLPAESAGWGEGEAEAGGPGRDPRENGRAKWVRDATIFKGLAALM